MLEVERTIYAFIYVKHAMYSITYVLYHPRYIHALHGMYSVCTRANGREIGRQKPRNIIDSMNIQNTLAAIQLYIPHLWPVFQGSNSNSHSVLHAADVRDGARLECFPSAPSASPGVPTHDQSVVHDGLGHVLSAPAPAPAPAPTPAPAPSLPSSALLRAPKSARTLRSVGLGLHALAHADASAHAARGVGADGRQRPSRLEQRQPHRSGHGDRISLCGGSVPSSAAAATVDPTGGIAGTGGHDGDG